MHSTRPKAPRKLRPKPPVTALPLVVSDQTSFDLVGLTNDQFRDVVKAFAIPHTVRGHRLLVRSDALLLALEKRENAPVVPEREDEEDGLELSSAADVLAALGRRAS